MSELKEPWGAGTPWRNSVAFFTFLRGCLRKAWSRHPTKLNVLKKQRIRIPNPNPKGKVSEVWGAVCAMCNGTFVLKDIQVDHITPAGTLTKREDIQAFAEKLLFVTEDGLRLVCKGCNSALAYADKQGMSFQEALAEKQAIAIIKDKKDKIWLEARGILPASNVTARRKQIIDILKKEAI